MGLLGRSGGRSFATAAALTAELTAAFTTAFTARERYKVDAPHPPAVPPPMVGAVECGRGGAPFGSMTVVAEHDADGVRGDAAPYAIGEARPPLAPLSVTPFLEAWPALLALMPQSASRSATIFATIVRASRVVFARAMSASMRSVGAAWDGCHSGLTVVSAEWAPAKPWRPRSRAGAGRCPGPQFAPRRSTATMTPAQR